jgi:glycosyltransferase involved in cell wall biosynthesis
VLQRELDARAVELEVLFMAATEPGRFWQPQAETWQFNGRVVSGAHPAWRSMHMHLNPGIWASVLRHTPTWLIIGGGWQFPSSLGLFLMRPFYRQRTHSLVWAEANHRFSDHLSGTIAHLRRLLLNSADGLIVPGKVAVETAREYWNVSASNVVYWPNLVDETFYFERVAALRTQRDTLRAQYQIPLASRVLFWPARLDEYTKGILNFLRPAVALLPEDATIVIAGEGPDRATIEGWLADHPHLDVRLIGHVDQTTILEHLALADVFILPSLRDPNPLSVIEALWAGLPVLVSINCGNWPEAVEVGKNGWLIDPEQLQETQAALQDLLSYSPERLRMMGERSLEIARTNFSSHDCTRRFVDSLLATFPPKR